VLESTRCHDGIDKVEVSSDLTHRCQFVKALCKGTEEKEKELLMFIHG